MTGLVALCNGNGVVPEEVQGVNSLETGLVGNDSNNSIAVGNSAGNSACE